MKNYDKSLEKLGKFKKGKSCLYIDNLKGVDIDILKEIITNSVKHVKKLFPK